MKIKKVISLLSGGIDSAVSSYLMMKAGVEVVLVHFFNEPAGVDTKIAGIAKTISKHQPANKKTKLYLVPFRDAQLEVIKTIPSEYRMIVYKRMMLMIAAEIAKKEKPACQGLVMGDSLGQVASQTLDNIRTIYSAAKFGSSQASSEPKRAALPSKLPILTPLLGMDKEEIVRKSKEIGTYETSIAPYLDCCSFVIGKHPATRARLADVEQMEKNLKMKKIIADCVKKAKIKILE